MSLSIIPPRHREAETRQADKEVAIGVKRGFLNQAQQVVARHERTGRPAVDRLHAQIRKPHVVRDEIAQLLHPFLLNVLPRRDDEHPEVRLEMAEQCQRPEGDVRLAHADFVGEISHAFGGEQIVDGDRAVELRFGARAGADALAKIEQAAGSGDVNHRLAPPRRPS